MAMSVMPPTAPGLAKRKLGSSTTPAPDTAAGKRQRVDKIESQVVSRLPSEPHESILTELRPKYDVATFSVISSTSITKRIDQILAHLSRFHPIDMAVLPGVVLMHARSRDAAKMVSVTELVRRKIHDAGQKWYQYNRLYEIEARLPQGDTVIEETVIQRLHHRGGGHIAGKNCTGPEDGFDASSAEISPCAFDRAVLGPPKPEHALYMSIFLSRVPIPELRAKSFITSQTNSDTVDQQRRRQFG